jgi:hypothetical protein
MGAGIYVAVDNYNVTTAGAVLMAVAFTVMALALALLFFGVSFIWSVRTLTPIVVAVLCIATTWLLLPSLTAPEVPLQIHREVDAMNDIFTGRAEIKDCAFVGDNTAADLKIIGRNDYPNGVCVVEIRYEHVSLKAVPMGSMALADIKNFPSADFRTIRLWFPVDGTVIIFVYRPGAPFYRQDVETQGRPSFTALSTRYVLGKAD